MLKDAKKKATKDEKGRHPNYEVSEARGHQMLPRADDAGHTNYSTVTREMGINSGSEIYMKWQELPETIKASVQLSENSSASECG